MKNYRYYFIALLLCLFIQTGLVSAQEMQFVQDTSGVQPLQQSLQPQVKSVDQKTVTDRASGFEQYIAGTASITLSTDIRQFGYDLFEKPPSTFAPVTSVPVGPGYVFGPGDEIKITIWGKIDGVWNVVVDRDGNISLPKIGILGVTGLTFQECRGPA